MSEGKEPKLLTHEQSFPKHEEEFRRVNKRIHDLEDFEKKVIVTLEGLDKSFEFIHKRFDQRESQTDAIVGMTKSVEMMTKQIESVVNEMKESNKMTLDHEYRISSIEESSIQEDIKEIKKVVGKIEGKIVELENAPAKKVAQYVDHGFKAVIVVLFLGLLYLISDGRLGG